MSLPKPYDCDIERPINTLAWHDGDTNAFMQRIVAHFVDEDGKRKYLSPDIEAGKMQVFDHIAEPPAFKFLPTLEDLVYRTISDTYNGLAYVWDGNITDRTMLRLAYIVTTPSCIYKYKDVVTDTIWEHAIPANLEEDILEY